MDQVSIDVEVVVEREVVGVEKERGGLKTVRYLLVGSVCFDLLLVGLLRPCIFLRAQNNKENIFLSRLCINHTFDLTHVTTVTYVNLHSNPEMYDVISHLLPQHQRQLHRIDIIELPNVFCSLYDKDTAS